MLLNFNSSAQSVSHVTAALELMLQSSQLTKWPTSISSQLMIKHTRILILNVITYIHRPARGNDGGRMRGMRAVGKFVRNIIKDVPLHAGPKHNIKLKCDIATFCRRQIIEPPCKRVAATARTASNQAEDLCLSIATQPLYLLRKTLLFMQTDLVFDLASGYEQAFRQCEKADTQIEYVRNFIEKQVRTQPCTMRVLERLLTMLIATADTAQRQSTKKSCEHL